MCIRLTRYAFVETKRVQRIHIHIQIYTHVRVRDVSFSLNEDIAYTRVHRYSKTYTRAHAFVRMSWKHMPEYMSWNFTWKQIQNYIFDFTRQVWQINMKTVCGAPIWKTKVRMLTKGAGDFLIKIAVASKCKGVRKWEDGLRHRSIGTLVTSAEPRAERVMSLLAFIT